MDSYTVRQLSYIRDGLSGCLVRTMVGTGRDRGEKSEQAAISLLSGLQDLIETTDDIEIKVLAYDVDEALNYSDAADLWNKISSLIDKLEEILGDG